MCPDPTVFVVDDERCIVDSLSMRLAAEGLRCKTYTSAQSFLADYSPTTPGCLVVDACMPGMTGLDLLRDLHARGDTMPVIVLTAHPQVPAAVEAIKGGAVDYIEKDAGNHVLLAGIRQALQQDAEGRQAHADRDEIRARLATLSPRQREVLDQVVAGKSSKEIARALGRHKKTIESHRTFIMRKMQAESVADLVRMVLTASQPDH